MTPKLILDRDNRVKVVQWPEEPECKKHCDYTGICESIANPDAICHCNVYQKVIEQAIVNAVPFKNKEDEDVIKLKLTKQEFPIDSHIDVSKLEQLKPYDVPEGIAIKIKAEILPNTGMTAPLVKPVNNYAFIFRQPKEETQDELWHEVFNIIYGSTLDKDYWNRHEIVKSKFGIERIK